MPQITIKHPPNDNIQLLSKVNTQKKALLWDLLQYSPNGSKKELTIAEQKLKFEKHFNQDYDKHLER